MKLLLAATSARAKLTGALSLLVSMCRLISKWGLAGRTLVGILSHRCPDVLLRLFLQFSLEHLISATVRVEIRA